MSVVRSGLITENDNLVNILAQENEQHEAQGRYAPPALLDSFKVACSLICRTSKISWRAAA